MYPRILIAFLIALCQFGCTRGESKSAIPSDAVVLNFHVTGMHCDSCANAIKGKLATLKGVFASDASFEDSSATVMAANPQVAEQVLAAVKELGYEGELEKQ